MREGYVYAPDQNPGVMSAAKVASKITVSGRRPPFIVVDHALETVIVAKWPGKLWRVRVLDAVTPEDEQATGVGKLRPDAWYTRAVTVDVLEELPASSLFGAHGSAVSALIAKLATCDQATAERLASSRHELAGEVYSQAWGKWCASNEVQTSANHTDFTGTLQVPVRGKGTTSPINKGFSVVYEAIRQCALAMQPPAVTIDEEGEQHLKPEWLTAAWTCLEAAMAVGAPHLLTDEEKQILTAAWNATFRSE
jgi:hypothetical protein